MSKYIIISKSRHNYLLSKIIEIVENSSASKQDVGKIQETINKIHKASFTKETKDIELANALNKFNGGNKDE